MAMGKRKRHANQPAMSIETLITAAEQIEAVLPEGDGLQEVVGDKGYHSNQSLVDLEAVGVRSYISPVAQPSAGPSLRVPQATVPETARPPCSDRTRDGCACAAHDQPRAAAAARS